MIVHLIAFYSFSRGLVRWCPLSLQITAWLSLPGCVFLLAPSVIFGFLALSYSPYRITLLGISQDQVLVICKVGLVHYIWPLLSP